ncbi:MAG: hypothetical protein DRJ10_05195 [Bacteroidetes bacterium]|nr:MAG: hypothetical protein DRJ10_05195 [Bacteroidota bacterium]
MNYLMFVKIHLIIIFSVILISCSQNQQAKTGNTFEKSLMLLNLPQNYEFSVDASKKEYQEISFFNNAKKRISSGDVFQFRTNIPFYVRNIKLSNKLRSNLPQQYFFKLYINDKLIGKYKVGERIELNREVFSLRMLFLKTENEHLVEGWSGNTIFRFLKTIEHQKEVFSPQIKLSVKSKLKINFEIFRPRKPYKKNVLYLNRKFIKSISDSNLFSVNALHMRKDDLKTIQYSFRIYDDGFFSLYQLISDNVKKKIIREFFFEGNWQCVKLNSQHAKIEFEGELTGYFPNKKEQIVHNEDIKIESVLYGTSLKSDKLLDVIYLDFPDDAFVNVKSLIPELDVEIAYASEDNFTGVRLYPCNKCFLRYEVAKALSKVQTILKQKQMSLKLFDCYRPFSVQAIMFKKFPVPGYVADSIGGSVHNRGSAVDLSIVDKNGLDLNMGTEFDELSPKSNHNYQFFSDTILKNRLFLKELMQSCNFTAIRSEWWHYNYFNARKFPKVNDTFLCD